MRCVYIYFLESTVDGWLFYTFLHLCCCCCCSHTENNAALLVTGCVENVVYDRQTVTVDTQQHQPCLLQLDSLMSINTRTPETILKHKAVEMMTMNAAVRGRNKNKILLNL